MEVSRHTKVDAREKGDPFTLFLTLFGGVVVLCLEREFIERPSESLGEKVEPLNSHRQSTTKG